jgi:molecular chaperone GrpE (heat shock protein)
MRREKVFLRGKFIEFQLKIAELNRTLAEREESYGAREKDLYRNLLEILDAFENLDETIQAKEDRLDKTARRMAKTVRAIQRKLVRLLKANHIVQIEFQDKRARMDYCKVVETQEAADMENETILAVVRNGYIDQRQGTVLRKAEVITVLNG